MEDLNEAFGYDCVFLDRLTDAARCLRLRERDAIGKSLDRFERRFPQLFASVYLGYLPKLTSIRQFGFWLLNRAAVTSVDLSKPNHHGILLVVDLSSQTAAFTPGYLIEPYLRPSDAAQILKAGHPMLVAGDYARGVSKILRRLSRVLRARAAEVAREPEKFVAAYDVAHDGLGLTPIREGHGPSGTRPRRTPKATVSATPEDPP